MNNLNCSQAIVKMLENMGVTHVFGVPGGKIDSLFVAFKHSNIKLVAVRHEQNAAFMAAAFGRLTGRVGVCVATSGPGATNLITGLAAATSEGDPVLAIGGEVPVSDRLKKIHQSLDTTTLMKSVTKYSAEIVTSNQLAEIFGNAVRAAESGRPGAAFISLPKDVGVAEFTGNVDREWGKPVANGSGAPSAIEAAAQLINTSQRPVVLFGMQASAQNVSESVQNFLAKTKIPYTSTFQGPGKWAQPKDKETFVGRVGLFRNQPADQLLNLSDCVITVGYDPVEYEPGVWNKDIQRKIIAIDVIESSQDNDFVPDAEIIGDIGLILDSLADKLNLKIDTDFSVEVGKTLTENKQIVADAAHLNNYPVHPLRVIHEMQKIITSDTHIALDVGSNYIWMNRYHGAEYARQILVSNGQQVLGVGLPWAIASSLIYPDKRIISVSGDGGFLFSSMELETAKRLGVKFIHLIWDSGSYDMVGCDQVLHYGNETSGVQLGHYDIEAYAESFGCKGYQIKSANELGNVLQQALTSDVPVLINIPIDYTDNVTLMENVLQHFVN